MFRFFSRLQGLPHCSRTAIPPRQPLMTLPDAPMNQSPQTSRDWLHLQGASPSHRGEASVFQQHDRFRFPSVHHEMEDTENCCHPTSECTHPLRHDPLSRVGILSCRGSNCRDCHPKAPTDPKPEAPARVTRAMRHADTSKQSNHIGNRTTGNHRRDQ